MAAAGIVQYVLVRSDLCKTLGWPVGALVAQACHASTAVIHLFYNHEDTQKYLADLDNMHKIVLAVSKCSILLLGKKFVKSVHLHIFDDFTEFLPKN